MSTHDALFEQIVTLYEPTLFKSVVPAGPFNVLADVITTQCENDVTLLDEFPRRLIECEPGSVRGCTLLLAYERAAFSRQGPWLTPQLALGYSSWIRKISQDQAAPTYGKEEIELAPHWARLCPPGAAQWLVLSPAQTFEVPEVATIWRITMERLGNRVAQWVEEGVPGWCDEKLARAWARPVLDGIRPSGGFTSPKAEQKTAQRMQCALNLLGHDAVHADPCFARWEADWKKNKAAWATWKAHGVLPLQVSAGSSPLRARTRP